MSGKFVQANGINIHYEEFGEGALTNPEPFIRTVLEFLRRHGKAEEGKNDG